jgi:hypothetical protein
MDVYIKCRKDGKNFSTPICNFWCTFFKNLHFFNWTEPTCVSWSSKMKLTYILFSNPYYNKIIEMCRQIIVSVKIACKVISNKLFDMVRLATIINSPKGPTRSCIERQFKFPFPFPFLFEEASSIRFVVQQL